MTPMNDLSRAAGEIENFFDLLTPDANGLSMYSLRLDTMSPWKDSDFTGTDLFVRIPGYGHLSHAGFMSYENTGMVMGTFLSAMCFKHLASGDAGALRKAGETFRRIVKLYELSQKVAPGFFCKPWGGTLTDETSSDQFIYAMSGLDDYYELADREERRTIQNMIIAMADFWLSRQYVWNYFGAPLHWRECRFISFMALALKYGGGGKFERELTRLTARQEQDPNTPFQSTLKECTRMREDGAQCIFFTPENSLSTFLSLEAAMNRFACPRFLDICRDSLEYGSLGIADDGTSYSSLIRYPGSDQLQEMRTVESRYTPHTDLSPIFGLSAPYRKGGMQSAMFSRFALASEKFIPDHGVRVSVERILRKIGEHHLTWYEDPYRVFPPEIRWMTNVFSGDAAAHWLWCYWKMHLLDSLK